MHARTRAMAVLVILVVTAGCLAAPGVDDASAAELDASTAAAEHEQALETAGSYTYTVEASATLDGQSAGTSTITAAVDIEADRARVESESLLGPVTAYVENGSVYQRIGTEEPRYQTADSDVEAAEVVSSDVAAVVSNHTFAPNGTASVNGERVRTYEANSTGENATLRQDLGDGIVVETVEASLSVNDDGVVVRQQVVAAVSIEGEQSVGTYTRTVTYTDVGSTTVERPSWLDDAREATDADA